MTALMEESTASWRQLSAALADEGIQVLDYSELKVSKQKKLAEYFEREIFPVLTPVGL